MNQKHNAHCPICESSWQFKVSEAILDENEKEDLLKHGSLNVVCEDCCNSESDFEAVQMKLEEQGRVLSFAI